MNDEHKPCAASPAAAARQAFPTERARYKALLVSNPNYFGSLEASPFPPVLPLAGNTYYEELGCVGYHPQQEMLEGVVYVTQPSGYGGALCGGGSTEYVRFYLSFDNGVTWQDQGLTSFQAWDVPEGTEGSRRLEYAVQLKVAPSRALCFSGTKLVLARGILSWNVPPPPNQPNWNPPWGNRRDATIEVEPRRLIIFDELFKTLKVKLPSAVAQALDLQQPVALKKAALAPAERAALYKDSSVPPQRWAHAELHALAFGNAVPTPQALAAALPGVKLDASLIDGLFPLPDLTDGDTSYEELHCIGLDPNAPDTLCGVLNLKRSSGFNGGPCTSGSTEYVSWWADTDGNGSFETFLGTASVRVHDITDIPAGGVNYAVRLPVDFSALRKTCKEGAVVVPIRAILSWNVAVPGNTPGAVPTWGNREETLVLVTPLGTVHGPAGKMAIVGGIPVSMIDDASGTTTADAKFALNNLPVGGGAPFGGVVTVQGTPLPSGYTYKVEVLPDGGGTPEPVLSQLMLTRGDGSTYTVDADPVTQRFPYQAFVDNTNSLLARWFSHGDAGWTVRLSAYDPGGTLVSTDSQHLQLDNTGPEAAISITSGTGNCGKFPSGSTISGVFTATDLHIGSWSIGIKPPGLNDPGEGITTPHSGNTNETGTAWSVDTEGMVACGYVAEIVVSDRTIVHSQGQGWTTAASVGFCLEAAAEPQAE